MRLLKSAFTVVLLLYSTLLPAQNKDSIAVLKAAENFVTAFNQFKWEAFRSSFTNDATMFHPVWEQGKRRAGRQEIEATWIEVFPEFIDSTNTATLNISPKDLHIQLYGNTAIVTFHLGDGITRLSRRTLVMVKQKNEWKIAHLHASFVTAPPEEKKAN